MPLAAEEVTQLYALQHAGKKEEILGSAVMSTLLVWLLRGFRWINEGRNHDLRSCRLAFRTPLLSAYFAYWLVFCDSWQIILFLWALVSFSINWIDFCILKKKFNWQNAVGTQSFADTVNRLRLVTMMTLVNIHYICYKIIQEYSTSITCWIAVFTEEIKKKRGNLLKRASSSLI